MIEMLIRNFNHIPLIGAEKITPQKRLRWTDRQTFGIIE